LKSGKGTILPAAIVAPAAPATAPEPALRAGQLSLEPDSRDDGLDEDEYTRSRIRFRPCLGGRWLASWVAVRVVFINLFAKKKKL
jgi:hypothetical protein